MPKLLALPMSPHPLPVGCPPTRSIRCMLIATTTAERREPPCLHPMTGRMLYVSNCALVHHEFMIY